MDFSMKSQGAGLAGCRGFDSHRDHYPYIQLLQNLIMRLLFVVLLIAVVLTSGCFHKYENFEEKKNLTKSTSEKEKVPLKEIIKGFFHGKEDPKIPGIENETANTTFQAEATLKEIASGNESTSQIIMRGVFESANQTTTGIVWIYNHTNGTTILFLDNFWTYFSEDLYVYLSSIKAPTTSLALDLNKTEIAKLQSFKGDQNYTITNIPIRQHKSVVIYEKTKKSIFGYALISETEKIT